MNKSSDSGVVIYLLVLQSMGTSPGGSLGVGTSGGYVPVSVVEAGRGVVLGWRAPPPAAAAPPQQAAHHHGPPPAPHHHLQLAEASDWPPRGSLIAVDSATILPVPVFTTSPSNESNVRKYNLLFIIDIPYFFIFLSSLPKPCSSLLFNQCILFWHVLFCS
jgi:hypothetical protein